VAWPAALVTALVVFWALARLERALPPPHSLLTAAPLFRLGKARWPWLALVLAAAVLLAGVPFGSLFWRVGVAGTPPRWSLDVALGYLGRAFRAEAGRVAGSLLFAALAGALTAAAALLLCWLSLGSRRFRLLTFGLAALLWALPGPVVGIGLKETIMALVVWSPDGPLAHILYNNPSPAPVLWADLLRYLPCAVAALWPVVRMLPQELRDSVRVDGAGPAQELRHVVWPLSARAVLWTALVIAALSLGEVGAVAMRVETPGWDTFAHALWAEMHYGVQNYVAAQCLLLLAAVVAVGGLAGVGLAFLRRARSP
jgi:ABC-type Fe3+ transport system permease subunit